MSDRTTRWPLAPHTKIKHEILKRYLDAWLPILGSWAGRVVFIDGFAGPGRYSGGEPGSPVIALQALLGHPYFKETRPGRKVVFLFIERDPERAAALREELAVISTPQWVTIGIEEGEFADHMTKVLNAIESGGNQLAPTFAFIDPFGFTGLPLALVARIVGHPSCECLVSFMYEDINRFIAHPNAAIQAHYDELFGTEKWRAIITIADPETRKDRMVNLYREQLQKVAGLRYVRTFEMVNQGNRTEYFLFYGTNSKRGLSKMKEAMWRADPVAGQVFSDRSVSDQGVLFESEADTTPLRRQLQGRFGGKGWIPIQEVSDFVLEVTAYSEIIHLKSRTLRPMESEGHLEARHPTRIVAAAPSQIRPRSGSCSAFTAPMARKLRPESMSFSRGTGLRGSLGPLAAATDGVLGVERHHAPEILDRQARVERNPRLVAGAPLEDTLLRHAGVQLGAVGGIDEQARDGRRFEAGIHRVEGASPVRALVDAVGAGADVQDLGAFRVEPQHRLAAPGTAAEVAMLFSQLARADSLREICNGLACCEGKLVHVGIAGSRSAPLRRSGSLLWSGSS